MKRNIPCAPATQPTEGSTQAERVLNLAGADLGAHESLIAACKTVPKGVVFLLSALRFHSLTTQAPFEVWMAICRSS